MDAVPDYAEPVITTPAQLRSSPGAHSRDPLVPSGYETTALPPSHWLRLQFLLCRRPFSLRRDPPRRRQRGLRPGDELIGFVKQPLRHAPKREVDGAALLRVIE